MKTQRFKSKIIAFDKIANKIEKLKELCARLGAVCIECHCQDVTKIGCYLFIIQILSFDYLINRKKNVFC